MEIPQPGSPAARLPHRPSVGSTIRSPRSTSRMSVVSSPRHSIAGALTAASSKSSDDDSKTAVKVVIRVRPPLQPTDPGFDLIPQRFRTSTCEVPSSTNLVVASPQGKKLFVFDRVFDEDTTQDGLWGYLSDSVNSFVQGYNVSILAYGQSGAGKSYTMGTAGPEQTPGSDTAGVIPRAAGLLFEKLQGPSAPRSGLRSPARYSAQGASAFQSMHKPQQSTDKSWQLKATYVEIHNEQLRDLLVPESVPHGERGQVSIREDTKGRILLTGLTQVPINSVEDLLNALHFGSAIRQTDSTAINAKSSRSHAIFSLNLVQKKTSPSTQSRDKRLSVPLEAMTNPESTLTTDSKLHFVDLAGSERLKNTGAQGDRAKEGISINAGLASLGKVISQLSSRQPGGYISYRDSRLTRLLQDSLGGNAITYMVACVTPAEFHLSETLNTVTYAQRARAIQSKPEIQQAQDEKDNPARIERLQAEVAFLREQINNERTSEQRAAKSDNADRVGSGRRETELQNQLLGIQESYGALSQRHAKLITEISKARENTDEETPTLRDAIGDNALERLKRSNSLSEAVEQVVVEYEKTIQTLESNLSNTRSALSSSESELMERESKIAYMESMSQQLQARLNKVSDREANNDSYLRELETQIEGATSSEEKSSSLIASLRKELARIKGNESNSEEYISTLEERLAEAEQDQEIMQREIDRLEHVIERQRSIGRLDNLLAELDTIRKNDVDGKAGLKQTNGHDEDTSPVEPSNEGDAAIFVPKTRGGEDEPEKDHDDVFTGEALPEANVAVEKQTLRQPTFSLEEPSRPVSREEQQAAQSNFMADKLETITQELFDLRGEHESTVNEKDELQRKYEIVLERLSKLQEAEEEQQASVGPNRPESFLGHAGVNLNRITVDGQEPTSSSRSLESELSSSLRATPTLADELDTSREMLTEDGLGDDAEEASQEQESSAGAVNPAEVPLPEEDGLLAGELESLRKLHSEQEERVRELSMSYAKLQQQHQDTLGQMEGLKAEVSRANYSLRPSSPSMRSPTVRRKLSQDLMSSITNTDRTTRSFASLRNIALDNFETNIDVRQNFELNLNTIMTELHERSQRVEALDAEMQSTRREMESKQQIIAGLTRERSSLKASTGVDITVVGQMQSQLQQSEQQLRMLQAAHAQREKEWETSVAELKRQIDEHKAAIAVPEHSKDAGTDDTPVDHASHISRLEQQLSDWETKHNEAVISMKASEAGLLATIAALENSKAQAEQGSRDLSARHASIVSDFDQERAQHQETVSGLQKQIEDYQSASQDHAEQLSKLERSHSAILKQFDEDTKAKELTEKELNTHRDLVVNLESQLDSQKATIAVHEANLENLLGNLKTSHTDEVDSLRQSFLAAEKDASGKHTALLQEHETALRSLEEHHKTVLSTLQQDVERKQEDLEELLHDASTLLGHETDVGRFHGHLSDALSRGTNSEWEEKHAKTLADNSTVKEELQVTLAKCSDLESRVAELMVLNEETLKNLEQITQKEVKSSRLVQELEEQLTSNYDQQELATNRLSAMQGRQIQLEEAYHAKSEMEKELEDARLKVSLLESQLTDLRRRSLASTSRDSFTRDSLQANPPSFNRDSLSPEAAAIALARSSSGGSLGNIPMTRTRSNPNVSNQAATALPSPPPAIPLPPLPNSPQLGSSSPHMNNTSIDARAASPGVDTNWSRSPPGTPKTSYPPPSAFAATMGPDPALTAKLEEQESRIRTIEKHLFAEKQLTATLEEALVDLETSQNRARGDMDGWKRKCKELEDELVGLRKQRSESRASLQQVEEEREMRVRAERARMALEERMRELNNAKDGKKKKKGALNCF